MHCSWVQIAVSAVNALLPLMRAVLWLEGRERRPEAVRTFVAKEIDRLERVGEQSPEQSWIRTWLDRVFEMPWGTTSTDNLDLPDGMNRRNS